MKDDENQKSLKKQELFNENGSDDVKDKSLINGNSTGVCNLNQIKYNWANKIMEKMLDNFWVPERISMMNEHVTFEQLEDKELEAVKNTLSFLIFLDSFQCNNLPNIREFITSPEVANCISVQEFQEVIHSKSYQYILEGLFPTTQREDIYNKWRDDPVLLRRIKFISDIAEKFQENQNVENFKRVVVANMILEGIYFYQGFMLFHILANRKKLVETNSMIDYIETDEHTHLGIFVNIIREIMDVNGKDKEMIESLVQESVDMEIEWSNYIYGDAIIGISRQSINDYVKFLAQDRLKRIGYNGSLFAEKTYYNPYSNISSKDSNYTKVANFFVNTITEYDTSSSMDWSDI